MIKIDQFFDPESTTNQLTINFSTTIPHPDVFVILENIGNLNIEYVNVPNCFSKKILLPIRRSDDSNHLFTTDPGVRWHSPVGSSAAAALSSAWWIAQAPQTSHVMARTISSMSGDKSDAQNTKQNSSYTLIDLIEMGNTGQELLPFEAG